VLSSLRAGETPDWREKAMLWKAVLTLAAAAAMSVSGGPANSTVKANVPFAFRIADKTLPAGVYQVVSKDHAQVITLLDENGRNLALVTASRAGGYEYRGPAKLIFKRYGNTSFLRQIWWADEPNGRELVVSGTEKEAQKQGVRVQTATVVVERMR
jgi:hypothetical protein